jgi:hypothetical protein
MMKIICECGQAYQYDAEYYLYEPFECPICFTIHYVDKEDKEIGDYGYVEVEE